MTNFPEERLSQQELVIVFDRERASSYDKIWAKLAPIRHALHYTAREAEQLFSSNRFTTSPTGILD
jgi:hypothetical protein